MKELDSNQCIYHQNKLFFPPRLSVIEENEIVVSLPSFVTAQNLRSRERERERESEMNGQADVWLYIYMNCVGSVIYVMPIVTVSCIGE
jgi:hypothetical protein